MTLLALVPSAPALGELGTGNCKYGLWSPYAVGLMGRKRYCFANVKSARPQRLLVKGAAVLTLVHYGYALSMRFQARSSKPVRDGLSTRKGAPVRFG